MSQTQPKTKKPQQNRFRALKWFLTWPRCQATLQQALTAINRVGQPKQYIVAQQFHKDGFPHIHAYVWYHSRVQWKQDKWDFQGYHGFYQGCRNYLKVIQYCKKDGNYISSFDIQTAQKKKGRVNLELLNTPPDQALQNGLISVHQLKSLQYAQSKYKQLKNKKQIQFSIRVIPFGQNWHGLKNGGILLAPPPLKKRHYYIYGPSNYGKSWPFKQFPLHCYSANTTNLQNYNGQQLFMIEQYKKNIPFYQINLWCDGSPIRNIGSIFYPTSPYWVIITSNFPPPTDSEWPGFSNRFIILPAQQLASQILIEQTQNVALSYAF